MKHLSGAPRLTHKHYTKLERLAKDKHSSLLQKSVNCDRKMFYIMTELQFQLQLQLQLQLQNYSITE